MCKMTDVNVGIKKLDFTGLSDLFTYLFFLGIPILG